MEPCFSIRDLTKDVFGRAFVLCAASRLDIPPGLFGLIGPNGAGKSRLMKILATLLDPDGGTAKLDGLDLVGNYLVTGTPSPPSHQSL